MEQASAFEDGEGALINPYQKYRMLLYPTPEKSAVRHVCP